MCVCACVHACVCVQNQIGIVFFVVSFCNALRFCFNLCIVPLIGHCIAMWYAVFWYLVKLTELETSWGRGDTVTY